MVRPPFAWCCSSTRRWSRLASGWTSGWSRRPTRICRCTCAARRRSSSARACGATRFGPISFFRIAAAANTMMRTPQAIAACDPGVPAPVPRPARPARGRAGGQDGLAGMRGRDQLRDVAPRDLPGGRAVRVARRAGAQAPARPGRGADQQAAPRSGSRAAKALPRAAVAFFRGLVGGLDDGTVTADDAPNAVECILDLVRGMYAVPARTQRTEARAIARGDPARHPDRSSRRTSATPTSIRSGSPARASSRRATSTSCSRARGRACASGSARPGWSAAAATCSIRARSHLTILAIASRWGLPGPQHFSRLFRAAYGCSPSEWRAARASPL